MTCFYSKFFYGHISDISFTWVKGSREKKFWPLCRIVIVKDIIGVEAHCKGFKKNANISHHWGIFLLIYTFVCSRDRQRKRKGAGGKEGMWNIMKKEKKREGFPEAML